MPTFTDLSHRDVGVTLNPRSSWPYQLNVCQIVVSPAQIQEVSLQK